MQNKPSVFKICDPIHHRITLDGVEKKILDTPALQRLQYITQMGNAYLLYPGAHHTRFAHSLGVLHLTSHIFDIITHHAACCLQEYDLIYWKRIVRAAALCHDIGHLPFSHTAEHELLGAGGHEVMTARIIQEEFSVILDEIGPHATEHVIKLVLHHKSAFYDPSLVLTPWEAVLSEIITGDNFGADRIDYLVRDSFYTGVHYGEFDYMFLIESLRWIDDAIGIIDSGMQAVESLWVARYMMYTRVYRHPKTTIYAYHLKSFMKEVFGDFFTRCSVKEFLHHTDIDVLMVLKASQNKHAQICRREREPYVEVPLLESPLLEFVHSRAHKDLMQDYYIDFPSTSPTLRLFPVLYYDRVLRSDEFSSFLQTIPLMGQGVRLFIDQEKKEELLHLMMRAEC